MSCTIVHAQEEERREQEKRAKREAMKSTVKADLEAQMRANVLRKTVVPMTEIERKINKQLMEDVSEFRTTGRVRV